MEKHNFTHEQTEKMYEFLKWIHALNSTRKNTVSNLETYKDKDNNFYASYIFSGYEKGEPVSRVEYVEIDKEGEKTLLNDTYKTETAITRKFDTLQKISLNG